MTRADATSPATAWRPGSAGMSASSPTSWIRRPSCCGGHRAPCGLPGQARRALALLDARTRRARPRAVDIGQRPRRYDAAGGPRATKLRRAQSRLPRRPTLVRFQGDRLVSMQQYPLPDGRPRRRRPARAGAAAAPARAADRLAPRCRPALSAPPASSLRDRGLGRGAASPNRSGPAAPRAGAATRLIVRPTSGTLFIAPTGKSTSSSTAGRPRSRSAAASCP